MSQLFILAVDQRPWLTQELYGHSGPATSAQRAFTTEAKHLVFEALAGVRDECPPATTGILVDAELGPGVPERAKQAGITLAMPVEKAGQRLYQTEFTPLNTYIGHYEPDLIKVLVRYNPEDPDPDRTIQRERLALVSEAAQAADRPFLFELLVPPVEGEAADQLFIDSRPALTRQAMREIAADMNVDIWKLEPQGDLAGYQQAEATARDLGGRCVLLGAGRPLDDVLDWIRDAAAAGFMGFAVGRSLWWEAVSAFRDDPGTREAGAAQIGSRYLRCVRTFTEAARS
ncbi:MAG: 2-deoxy-5-keto-D-gluconate 6-phosphate aldolase domain-containing protein [Propioniciclava sp.]